MQMHIAYFWHIICGCIFAYGAIPPDEYFALEDFYLSTQGTEWRYQQHATGADWDFSGIYPHIYCHVS